jgi:2-polyprenyl-3-methyl-5-hydroxy-6-metoxy-1,4-benzoquinol methylase
MNNHFSKWEEAVRWLRSQPDSRDLVLAAYYDDPLIGAAKRYWESLEWQGIRKLLGKTRGQVLDVGAGRGIASYALARDGFIVTALEPDESCLVGAGAIRSLAQESGLPITVVQEFSEKLPFDDCEFDIVFARAVLHHTKDLAAASGEFFRVLKPGGSLIAVREHVISRQKDLPVFLSHHPLHHLYGGESAFLLSEYTNALSHAGFKIESVIWPLESVINYAP